MTDCFLSYIIGQDVNFLGIYTTRGYILKVQHSILLDFILRFLFVFYCMAKSISHLSWFDTSYILINIALIDEFKSGMDHI